MVALPEPVPPSQTDIRMAKETSRRLSRIATPGRALRISPGNGESVETEQIEIPAGAVPLIQAVLAAMARGDAVSIVPIHARLTTQQAADLLGVSRPYLIGILEAGKLGYTKVGKHRRIVLQDLLAFKRKHHEASQKGLDELAQETENLGIEY